MCEVMLDLAATGVDVLRLDAVPFLWKRVGTNSQNQPEVHQLVQAFRAAVRIAAPAVAFKAEAIVSPQDLVGYLGASRQEQTSTSPTTTSSWCCCGARSPRARWR